MIKTTILYNPATGWWAQVKTVVWGCPLCGETNTDYPELTNSPMCVSCSEVFDWSQVTPDKEM